MASPIPTNDGPLLPWLQNFCVKFPLHAGALGYTLIQVSAYVADCNMLIYLLQTYVPALRHDAAEAVAYKDLIKNGPIGTPSGAPAVPTLLPAAPATVPAGILPRLRALVQEIKARPGYNEAIGTDLGIIAVVPALNLNPPLITVIATQAGNTTLGWTKNGWSGVRVQSRPQGATEWMDVGVDLFSPFVDTRPLSAPTTPEVREYRMCHLDGDTPLLNWSDVTVVTVSP